MIDQTRLNEIEVAYKTVQFQIENAHAGINNFLPFVDFTGELLSALRSLPKIHKASEKPKNGANVFAFYEHEGQVIYDVEDLIDGSEWPPCGDEVPTLGWMYESDLIAYFTQQQAELKAQQEKV